VVLIFLRTWSISFGGLIRRIVRTSMIARARGHRVVPCPRGLTLGVHSTTFGSPPRAAMFPVLASRELRSLLLFGARRAPLNLCRNLCHEVSYETVPVREPFNEYDVVAEMFEPADVVTADVVGVAPIEIVDAEVVVGDTMLEHVPQGHEHGVRHSDDHLLGATPSFDPVIERAVVTFLAPGRGPGRHFGVAPVWWTVNSLRGEHWWK
jgi:hypothetical protein